MRLKSLSLATALLLSSTSLLPFTFSLLPSPALAQATDPRKEEADQFLKLCREQWQQQQYEATIQVSALWIVICIILWI